MKQRAGKDTVVSGTGDIKASGGGSGGGVGATGECGGTESGMGS